LDLLLRSFCKIGGIQFSKMEGILKPSMKPQTVRSILIITFLLTSSIALNFPFVRGDTAQTASLRVYTANGFKPSLQALLPQVERSVGQKVSPEFDASKTLQQKIESGEAFDVAILSSNVMDDLIKQGEIAAAPEISGSGEHEGHGRTRWMNASSRQLFILDK
jgi:spermidine/putrescine-binding protein